MAIATKTATRKPRKKKAEEPHVSTITLPALAEEHLDVPTLETWLWDAACAIRGAADAPKFKDFILPLVFFKRLSDVFDDEFAAQIKDVLETPTLIPEDKEAIVYCTCPGEKT